MTVVLETRQRLGVLRGIYPGAGSSSSPRAAVVVARCWRRGVRGRRAALARRRGGIVSGLGKSPLMGDLRQAVFLLTVGAQACHGLGAHPRRPARAGSSASPSCTASLPTFLRGRHRHLMGSPPRRCRTAVAGATSCTHGPRLGVGSRRARAPMEASGSCRAFDALGIIQWQRSWSPYNHSVSSRWTGTRAGGRDGGIPTLKHDAIGFVGGLCAAAARALHTEDRALYRLRRRLDPFRRALHRPSNVG